MIFKPTRFNLWTVVLATTLLLCSFIALAGQGKSEYESNNTREKSDSITTEPILYGNLDAEDKDDWFRILGPLGTKAKFTITVPKNKSFKFTVYRDEDILGKTTGKKPEESVTCEITGTVYIHVQRITGAGDYKIKITKISAPKPVK